MRKEAAKLSEGVSKEQEGPTLSPDPGKYAALEEKRPH